ncbi:hypothetical protein JRG42_17115 [Pseudomonas granadensis]|uniref:Uncharacterized protein n=1 Tax=Pseudomonas granadensis TaxID=1421430 RepID=A0ABX7GLM5_9PSED|nr:hypothetical protein [Pseudomonas granadensis]MBN6772580.1 hypothetical protein [Pseudomonas granadensis]MBN6805901.1 hypothetical protein [Pseudomonas granadensis]MBN6831059.1 hypothetical protein [Pseudomonas granadensis]MBN6840392.1 hypothetical protein [Pseudomonas granadensis]MBN6867963.1 hypothetical protein [Pseudomonas granadensis]
MSSISREEFDARIETIEARMDARMEGVSMRIDAFLAAQAERDKASARIHAEMDRAQSERDKRFEMMSSAIQNIAQESKEAIRQASTTKANVWAAAAVQLVGLVAIVVGACYANQANTYAAVQTTLAAIQAGKEFTVPMPPLLPWSKTPE